MVSLKEDLQTAISALKSEEIVYDALCDTQSSWLIDYNEYTGEECSAYATADEIRELEWNIYTSEKRCKNLEKQIRRLRAALTVEAVEEDAWRRRKHAVAAWALKS